MIPAGRFDTGLKMTCVERDESKIVEGNMHALDFRMVGADDDNLAIRRTPDKRMLGSEEPCWIGSVACKT